MNATILLFGLALAPLCDAIAEVESDNGTTSRNKYQITPAYVLDVIRICKLSRINFRASWPEVTADDQLSETCMVVYWTFYWKRYQAKHPDAHISYEWLARVHNGGPLGYVKSATEKYWAKVAAVLARKGVL